LLWRYRVAMKTRRSIFVIDKGRLARLGKSGLWIGAGIYVGFLLLGMFFADHIIFQPPPAGYRDHPAILKLQTPDGSHISARYFKNPNAKLTILFSHGNGEDIGGLDGLARYFIEAGLSMFVYDYHGYGTSEGSPTEANAYRDIDAAYDYLTVNEGLDPQQIVLHGRSLGGAVSVDLAARRPVGGLILESTFVSGFRVLTSVPLFPVDRLESGKKMSKIQCPVLVIHGMADRVIPLWHGQRLFELADEPKACYWVPNAGHNNAAWIAKDGYFKKIRGFATGIENGELSMR
jgi:fermentation-respiration switch protein FrsA (DUF1100 family)